MIFNERLKLLRKEQGLTQTQVADKLSVTLRNYQRFEADGSTPNYVNLIKIADIFNVSLDYLMGLVDQPLSLSREEQTLLFPSSMTASQREFVIKLLSNWEAGAGEASTVRAGLASG